jgi:hypothetical protein
LVIRISLSLEFAVGGSATKFGSSCAFTPDSEGTFLVVGAPGSTGDNGDVFVFVRTIINDYGDFDWIHRDGLSWELPSNTIPLATKAQYGTSVGKGTQPDTRQIYYPVIRLQPYPILPSTLLRVRPLHHKSLFGNERELPQHTLFGCLTAFNCRDDGSVASQATWSINTVLNGPSAASSASNMGATLAINSDGTVIAAGDTGAANGIGGVYCFQRMGSDWQQFAILTTTTASATGLGTSVALSSDATFFVSGAPAGLDGYADETVAYTWILSASPSPTPTASTSLSATATASATQSSSATATATPTATLTNFYVSTAISHCVPI